jgi:uncharacterized GH25 family protein
MKQVILSLIMVATPLAAQAHEFWIEPDAYQVAPGADMVAELRVGQNFAGSAQSYLPRSFERFDLKCSGNLAPVDGRPGDRPAMTVTAPSDGLCVVIHQTRDYTLTYQEWEKFVAFIEHKDFSTTLADHAARGLPEADFVEQYSRYAKSLIAVGEGAGQDDVVGLETEIVAQANPYTDDMAAGLPVQVFYQGLPRADVQVELFEKAPEGAVEITLHRTDDEGRVLLPVKAGYSYLADAVVMRAMTPDAENDPVWESLWASLTFAVPAAQ